ncbi:hypothetical protein CHGG_00282 [Chaetomium globosum CBS 148.51]|uniref:Rhodopsin domain-containing protein n=1 Tax=Chaetomium globosum (strain ATCC 6205 / CBS 148.51 / DSM 1962 / NBRC 6347 / NRRL 1970) TaxID=306901 RepID=Q2HHM2_CHAGB|nr:uncharacterized protein CHGG_00282 [Chaetomium globosum CBS 148.51]EAQ92047.1 hypothetical protein CHGG_00282 [Chaetomium globosum CBS 148.51]
MGWTGEGPSLFAFSAGMLLFATLAVALRFVCRGYILRVLGLSDLCILFTLLFSLADTCILGIYASTGLELPKDSSELTSDEKQFVFKMLYASKLVVNFSVVMTKILVLLLFSRHLLDVLATVRRRTFLIVLTSVFGICDAITNIFACLPMSSFWNLDQPDHQCISIGDTKALADAVISCVLDAAIFCLPLPLIWPMTLPWRQKAWLYFAFALGFLVCAASAVRIYLVLGGVGIPSEENSLPYWVATEINVAIVIACIPTLRLLVVRIWPRLLETAAEDAKTSGNGRTSQPEQEF